MSKIFDLNEAVKNKLKVKWNLIEKGQGITSKDMKGGLRSAKTIFGTRVYQDNILVGSSSWCCAFCSVVAQHTITIDGINEPVRLVVFETPPDTLKQCEGLERYWAVVVGTDTFFPCHNWNPIPIKSPEDAKNYLTGWSA